MSEFVNWSYTAVNTLRQCNRKYYFSNILATHGRKTPVRRKAYELRAMQTLLMWQGSVIDKFIELEIIPAISRKEELNADLLKEQILRMAKTQFAFSLNRLYQNPEQKKGEIEGQHCILDIHELGRIVSDEEIELCYNNISKAIETFLSMQMPDGQLLTDFLSQANKLLPNVNSWPVYLEKAKVNPQIDLIAYQDWMPSVIDWKFSASYTSDYTRQLIIEGLTVYFKRLEKPELDPYQLEDIRLYEVNLYKGIVKEHLFDQEQFNDMVDYISDTSGDMYLLSGDKKYEDYNIDDFELTENQSSCNLCNFRTLCSYMLLNNNQYHEESYIKFVQDQQFA